MECYPKTILEFNEWFTSEEACLRYLSELRWPEGFKCPRCHCKKAWSTKRGLLVCKECKYQLSVKAGTLFQDTSKPLTMWFNAIWWITSQKTGTSAMGLKQVLGLGSYETAWTWLHKLRRAMVRLGRDRLSGRIEVDEAYVGGLEEGVRGRQTDTKALIAIAAQEDGKGIGRIRMQRIKDASSNSLHPFVLDVVEPGSVVHTDGWEGYTGLGMKGYTHDVTIIKGKKQSALELLPRVHRVVSLLKRWLMGTHQGAVSPEHLDYYLDEFTFRFNRRTSRHRGKLFYRLLQQAVVIDPSPYKTIVKRVR